ncbi:uncharacterized protein LOC127842404 [Dreissena polymorpha]|uniref:uncharacterized protein LOC127842404 n=1 Tax=Dreissena polymorpha TaxID=45954 RepID=UPI0022649CF1|nr:uncharacterized protein LOC127842404 [Dreissena polymorpha]
MGEMNDLVLQTIIFGVVVLMMSVGQCLWCQMDRQRDTEEKKKRNTEGNETSQAKPTEKKRAKLYTTDSENDKNAPDLLNKERTQRQDQIQRQRSHEASKQMLFGVYCNVVSTLEEYEARTNRGTTMPKSNINLPDQSRKTLKDVRWNVQTQLLVFEEQSKACPTEVKHEVNKTLRKKTLIWAAVREENKLEIEDTDYFICQLYEILVKGKTRHAFLDKPRKPTSYKTIQDTIPIIMIGKHNTAMLDETFKKDPKTIASSPMTRTAYTDDAFKLGACRLKRIKHGLSQDLNKDVEDFEREGPDDLK